MKIITRREWGFDGWARDERGLERVPYSVDERRQRTEFFTHYDGGNPVLSQTGPSVPRSIHAFHKSKGWKGIGYGHVIDSTATIYEGRGFDMVGSHCPDRNTSGYSVQFHLGGNEQPTAAMLTAARWLYDEACRRSGRTLLMRGHRDGFATACPGDNLYRWVRAGMPAPLTPKPPEEDDMQLTDVIPLTDDEKRTLGIKGDYTVANALRDAKVARGYGWHAKKDAAATLEIVKAMAQAGRPLTQDETVAAAEQGYRNAQAETDDEPVQS